MGLLGSAHPDSVGVDVQWREFGITYAFEAREKISEYPLRFDSGLSKLQTEIRAWKQRRIFALRISAIISERSVLLLDGLDHPLMYAAHKAAGGMTSIYRQIGIGCEKMFRAILQDTLHLSDEEVAWSYTVPTSQGKTRTLSLDGRIPLDALKHDEERARISRWLHESCERLEIDRDIRQSLKGIVFEVRQGYKSKDSKRQNADIANAITAYTKGYLPCVVILSQQIDQDIALRYTAEKWKLLTGAIGDASPHDSVYAFMRDVVGYDLSGFFTRNTTALKKRNSNRVGKPFNDSIRKHVKTTLTQRADYTFKYNAQYGRHGWLRLTPAYSVKLVEEILHDTPSDVHVFDPFSGTATTLLCSGYHSLQATGYELNPFLVWFGQVNTRSYAHETLLRVKEAINDIAAILAHSRSQTASQPPPIHHIERWWHEAELRFLCRLHACIEQYSPASSPEKDLLRVIFCRVIIRLSNAAFNHQSMSFKTESADAKMLSLFEDAPDYIEIFLKESQIVVNSASENPQGTILIVQGDARHLESVENEMFDLLITSPPYPNRMSYIRELRPYMYWLGYLTNGRDAGEIDWQAIGGTWGIATSRLNEWQRSNAGFYPSYFDALLSEIASHDNKNGRVLANYIAKYFEDMWRHLSNVRRVMKPNGKMHYIVGNSVFYGILVPVEMLFKEMFDALGFKNTSIRTIRKRNSKKQLYEYDISGQK